MTEREPQWSAVALAACCAAAVMAPLTLFLAYDFWRIIG